MKTTVSGGAFRGFVANSEGREATACLLGRSYAATPKIVDELALRYRIAFCAFATQPTCPLGMACIAS